MKCPTCGAWLSVLETRQKSDNSTYRRYECANGHRFTTNERILLRDINRSLESPTMVLQQSAALGDHYV